MVRPISDPAYYPTADLARQMDAGGLRVPDGAGLAGRAAEREDNRRRGDGGTLRRLWCLFAHRSSWQHFDRYLGDGYARCPRCHALWE